MPAIIDSAPDCVIHEEVDGTNEASVTANGEDTIEAVFDQPCGQFAGVIGVLCEQRLNYAQLLDDPGPLSGGFASGGAGVHDGGSA